MVTIKKGIHATAGGLAILIGLGIGAVASSTGETGTIDLLVFGNAALLIFVGFLILEVSDTSGV